MPCRIQPGASLIFIDPAPPPVVPPLVIIVFQDSTKIPRAFLPALVGFEGGIASVIPSTRSRKISALSIRLILHKLFCLSMQQESLSPRSPQERCDDPLPFLPPRAGSSLICFVAVWRIRRSLSVLRLSNCCRQPPFPFLKFARFS